MFDWGVLKCRVPESVRFCIGDLPIYTFLIPTHPYPILCISFFTKSDVHGTIMNPGGWWESYCPMKYFCENRILEK